jgi:hypothetical protein
MIKLKNDDSGYDNDKMMMKHDGADNVDNGT